MTTFIRFQFSALTLIALTISSNSLFAQQNALKIQPFQPVLGKITLQYERSTSPKNTMAIELQKWNERRQTGAGLFALGIFVSNTDVTTTKGYRIQVLGRHYTKKAFEGGFVEGGGYFGKHDIEMRSESSSLNTWAIFGPDPFSFYQSNTQISRYDNVRVGGLKIGGGWQKQAGVLTFECSGGLNANLLNSKNVRPTLGLKPVSPYARLAVGVRF